MTEGSDVGGGAAAAREDAGGWGGAGRAATERRAGGASDGRGRHPGWARGSARHSLAAETMRRCGGDGGRRGGVLCAATATAAGGHWSIARDAAEAGGGFVGRGEATAGAA